MSKEIQKTFKVFHRGLMNAKVLKAWRKNLLLVTRAVRAFITNLRFNQGSVEYLQ
jgi:hypothetical protein